MAPPELKSVHPLGKSPIVTIEPPAASTPMILAESGYISEYVTEHFGKHLMPEHWIPGKEGQVGGETESWLRYRFFMNYAEGSLMALNVQNLLFNGQKQLCHAKGPSANQTTVLTSPEIPFFVRPITRMVVAKFDDMYFKPNYKTHFGFLESELASSPNGGDFLCGPQLTSADILLSFPLFYAKSRKLIDSKACPKLAAYVDKLEASEGWKRSIKKAEEVTGEPFDLF